MADGEVQEREAELATELDEDIDLFLIDLPCHELGGLDLITSEILQALPPIAKSLVAEYTNKILVNKHSDMSKVVRAIMVAKNKMAHILENVRLLCIPPVMTVLVYSIVASRFSFALEKERILTENQEGLDCEGEYIRQVNRFLSRVNGFREKKERIVVVYINFANFLSEVRPETIVEVMRLNGFNKEDVLLMQNCLIGNSMVVEMDDGGRTGEIPLMKGLIQGSPISPLASSLLLSVLSRQLDQHRGEMYRAGSANNLSSGDDFVLIAKSVHEMEQMLKIVENFCEWAAIKFSKSNIIAVG
eukprot:763612-Hanusia_phi.AAC.23